MTSQPDPSNGPRPGRAGGADAPEDLRIRRLTALAEMEFAGEASAKSVLDHVAQVATELLPASVGASIIVSEDGGFRLAATTVPGQEAEAGDGRIRTEGGATRYIFDSKRLVVVNDTATDPFGESPLAKAFGVRAYVGVPIVAEGRAQGVLYALDGEPRWYADDELEFLQLLAGRAATATIHAKVFTEMKLARERSEALAWAANAVIAAEDLDEVLTSVVEGVAAAVAAEQGFIVTLDAFNRRVLDYAASSGSDSPDPPSYGELMESLAGQAIRERRVTITPSAAKPEATPAIVAPLRKGDRILGTLAVSRRPGRARFDSDEADLVLAMASQAAIAIDNVRLLEATRSTLRETESMYAISQALIESADLPEMLEAVALGSREAVGADGARIVTIGGDPAHIRGQAASGILEPMATTDLAEDPYATVLSHQVPMRVAEADHGGPLMVAVLKVHDRVLGLIMACREKDEAPFNEHEFDTLTTLAAQAAVAIENHMLFEEVQRLAVTDELTAVHSRRHLFNLGEREFAHAVRYRSPLAAIMFDLDLFKSINDTLGHVAGDEVLRGVADRCREVLREVDVLGRYGGEEFAVILPETDVDGAVTIAERLRERVGAEPIETSRGPVAVTVSAGVASLLPGVLDLKTLLDKADVAMYEAKRAGRNQVQIAD